MCWWSSLPFSLFLMEDASRRYGGVIVRRVGLWQGGKVGRWVIWGFLGWGGDWDWDWE